MLRLFVAAVAALTLTPVLEAQGPLKRLSARLHGVGDVTVAPTCTGPNCAAAFPQVMPGPGHVTHVAAAPAAPALAKVMKAEPPKAAQVVASPGDKPGALFCVLVRAEARK